ncbi:MAG: hypothetical protein GY795_09955 [Desulfobacterales bacterium]|nr:hypothetical protein [Desulfobacterales bacterium]
MNYERIIIKQAIESIKFVYDDIGRVGNIIEEEMRNNGFQAIGEATFTWEVSKSLYQPDDWLYRWFARCYSKNNNNGLKRVGFCIHLGDYSEELLSDLPGLLPLMNISILETIQRRDIAGNELRNILWEAGWHETTINDTVNQCVIKGEKEVSNGNNVRTATYFVDFLSLKNEDIIKKLVVKPMTEMFNGNEDWIAYNCQSDVIKIL